MRQQHLDSKTAVEGPTEESTSSMFQFNSNHNQGLPTWIFCVIAFGCVWSCRSSFSFDFDWFSLLFVLKSMLCAVCKQFQHVLNLPLLASSYTMSLSHTPLVLSQHSGTRGPSHRWLGGNGQSKACVLPQQCLGMVGHMNIVSHSASLGADSAPDPT